ncbi:MAG: ATP-binding protein [Trueperaceae bacterium]|nr:ATP-binding protein [Trueperaceae bacterium]
MSKPNPFRIGERVKGDSFANRDEEVAAIRLGILNGSKLLVHGPRRMGKSSTIWRGAEVAKSATGAGKPIVVGADVATATTLFDVAGRLLRSLYQETRSLRLRLDDLIGQIGPRVTVKLDERGGPPTFTFGIERRTASDEERRQAFEAVLERLSTIGERTRRPVSVVLDEFHAIANFGGETAEWHLRDCMQRYGALGFVCAGSQEALVRDLVGPKRAFYKMFELLALGPIDPGYFAQWIEVRLKRAGKVDAGVGAAVVELAGPRTQDVIQLARQLYFRGVAAGRVRFQDVEECLDEVVASEAALTRRLWSDLAPVQQDVLRVVALGVERLYSAEVRDQYGLGAPSSVHRAVEALTKRGLLVVEDGGPRFDSPFVRHWVEREVAGDVG